MSDTIQISGLNKWFGPHQVLRDINLGIPAGQKVVVIGPSGSGKSTLIRCINRLEPFQGGEVVVDGHALSGLRRLEAVRREVGMVFQSFNLFPHMNVLRNVMLAPMKLRGLSEAEARARAMALLERVTGRRAAPPGP